MSDQSKLCDPCSLCSFWAREGDMLNNHHPACPIGQQTNVRELVRLLGRLHAGIKKWGSEEDGVPDFLWDDWQVAGAFLGTKGGK